MTRDYTICPDDENGNVLWLMLSRGDNLAIPREINFSVVFPTEDEAMKFAIELLRNDQKVSFSKYDGMEGFPWQVEVHPFMPATYENITGYEKSLANFAAPFGGINDGWGSITQK